MIVVLAAFFLASCASVDGRYLVATKAPSAFLSDRTCRVVWGGESAGLRTATARLASNNEMHQTPPVETIWNNFWKPESSDTRRSFFSKVATAATAAASTTLPRDTAHAETAVSKAPKTARRASAISSSSSSPVSLCDPSVSSWARKMDGENRIIHIVGTAHISEESATLAGRVVRDVRPSAVFVELDAKRVGRIQRPPSADGERRSSDSDSVVSASGESIVSTSTTVNGSSTEGISAPVMSTRISGGSPEQQTPTSGQSSGRSSWFSDPFHLKEAAVNAASRLVTNSIKDLYTKLNGAGFSPGEEFVNAIAEGAKVGSKIVLGDRDVDVTMKRLTEALSETDPRALFEDSELEQGIEDLLPSQARARMEEGGAGSIADEGLMTKQELTDFVEMMKAKDNVKKIMGMLKETAPEIYMAMVGERDEYMAKGLDSLNEFPTTVAVMGMAHVDGVEGYLQRNGWKAMKISCALTP